MSTTVTVRNESNDLVLLGDRYLYPGQTREVPPSHFLSANIRYPNALVVVEGLAVNPELAEGPELTEETAPAEEAEPVKPKRSRKNA